MGQISFVVFTLQDPATGFEEDLARQRPGGQNTMNGEPVCRVEQPRPASPCRQGRGTQCSDDTGGGNGDPVGNLLARSQDTWPGT